MKKRTYKISEHYLAYIVVISLLLQSCSNFSNPASLEEGRKTENIQGLSNQITIKYLVDKEFTSKAGELVTFYEQNGQLQANVRIDEKQKEPNYKSLPVRIAQDVDLSQLSHLNKKAQKRLIHFNAPKNGSPGNVALIRGGLLGGMIEGDDNAANLQEGEEEYYEEDEDLKQANESILNEEVTIEKLLKMAERWKETDVSIGFIRVKADIEKVDSLWMVGLLRIPTEYDRIVSDQKQKYLNSRRDLLEENEKVNKPPQIEYTNNKLSFVDGRNRFANLRDMKATYIYIDVHEASYNSIIDTIKAD